MLSWISVWTNPAVTVVTNYVGEKTVHWSWRPRCFTPRLSCTGAEYMTFSAALLRGEVTWDAAHDDFLAAIGTSDRAALLAFDARETAGEIAFPRYQRVADVEVDETFVQAPEVTWRPCVDPADFEVLAETVVPMGSGDSFVLQYGVQSDGSCAAQHPGLLVGTTTPACSSRAQVFVDRLSGTLLWIRTPRRSRAPAGRGLEEEEEGRDPAAKRSGVPAPEMARGKGRLPRGLVHPWYSDRPSATSASASVLGCSV